MPSSPKDILIIEKKDARNELNKAAVSEQATENPYPETLEAKDQRIKNLEKAVEILLEQNEFLRKQLFGKKSEKNSVSPDQMKLSDFCDAFNEVELSQDPDAPEEIEIPIPKSEGGEQKTRKAKVVNEEKYKGLPVKEEYLDIPEEERVCPKCGTPLEFIGNELVRTELHYIPAKMTVVKVYSKNYGCPACKSGEHYDLPTIVQGKDGRYHMLHGMASSSTIAWLVYQKYCNSMPIERQLKDWKRLYGVTISSGTAARWIIDNAQDYILPVFGYCHKQLLARIFLMGDETPYQVLHEPGKRPESKSYMWVYRTGEDGGVPIILYHYEEGRGGYHAADFLGDFSGYFMCDGYGGYNVLKKVKRCSCWAHVRRYLLDAIPTGKKDDYSVPAVQGFLYVEKLFQLERIIHSKHSKDFESIRKARLEKEQPVLDAFWAWLDKQNPDKGTRMYKAVVYIRNRKDTLETYLQDGRCSFSNNLTEQKCKSFVIGRKNWLFSTSVNGAEASAAIYSIVETAKANGVNVYYYLRYLLETLSEYKRKELNKLLLVQPAIEKKELAKQIKFPEELLESVMPWQQKVRTAVENLYLEDLDNNNKA